MNFSSVAPSGEELLVTEIQSKLWTIVYAFRPESDSSKRIPSERTHQEGANGATFSSIAPSGEVLYILQLAETVENKLQ